MTKNFSVLIVDDEAAYRSVLSKILSKNGYSSQTAESGKDALDMLKKQHFDLVLTDLIMGGMTGMELLETIKSEFTKTEVIMITGHGTIKNAVEAIKKGAFSYFIKGNDPEELLLEIRKISKLITLSNENLGLKSSNSDDILLSSKNKAFSKLLATAKKAAQSDANILLLGESGVGKEVFAHYIHQASLRKDMAFVPVNCHAFQDTLLESELFGHKKGAFTGANEDRIGRFESSDGGTLFLDEIADTPLSTQVKLLRSIETHQIERLGSNQIINVNFRLIAATNRDIKEMTLNGDFREDFYYRISTITLEIPPLREHREDLPDLIDLFISRYSDATKKKIKGMEANVKKLLLSYSYPGNIRELKNIIERLVVLSDDGFLKYEDLPLLDLESHAYDDKTSQCDLTKTLKELRTETEIAHIKEVLASTGQNITHAAEILGISRRQLSNKINEYGLNDR
jgi:DNA-binding NtrC family response regulator